MTDKQDCDLQLTLNAQFGEKLLDSIHFPWSVQYDLQPSYYPFDVLDQDQAEVNEQDEAGAIVDDVLVEPLQQQYAGALGSTGAEDLAHTDAAEEDSDRRYNIDFHSVSLLIPEKPTITLGNPVKIDDLTVRVKARFKASVRVFGKEYSTVKTTPWVALTGRCATLKLSANGATIMGTILLDDIDLIAKVKIFKWNYNCHLGLTRIMNRQLAKRGAFELLDLSGFQQSLIPDADNIAVDRVEFDATHDQLLVKLFVCNTARSADQSERSQV